MKLIDGDALVRETSASYNMTDDHGIQTGYEICMRLAEDAPTIEPERKTGRWLPDNRPGGGFWVCSECKFPSEAFAANVLYKFCPNCGAYMGGGKDGLD